MRCYLGIHLSSCFLFYVRELQYYNEITEKRKGYVVLIMNNIAASGKLGWVPT